MPKVVLLKAYRRDKGTVFHGCGYKVGNFIFSQYEALGLDPTQIVRHRTEADNSISSEVYLVDAVDSDSCFQCLPDRQSVQMQMLTVIAAWNCTSFQYFIDKHFDLNDFGDKNVEFSAAFVLLYLNQDGKETPNVDVHHILNLMANTETESTIAQGMKIYLEDARLHNPDHRKKHPKHDYCSCIQNKEIPRNEGIVSYVLISNCYFTVDLTLERWQRGSFICRYSEDRKKISFIGMVIYKDTLGRPFEVFPICVSLKHILSSLCYSHECVKTSLPSHQLGSRTNSLTEAGYIVLVRSMNQVGSGIIISENIILTCSHILKDKNISEVTVFRNGVSYQAEVMFVPDDNLLDLALLFIISSSISMKQTAEFAPAPPKKGETVFAIGLPYINDRFKYDPWISSGCIVSKDVYGNLITSCAVHDGFSGGCLVDKRGRMIGMVCSKAVPVDDARASLVRLTQVLPTYFIIKNLLRFVSSNRNQQDKDILNEELFDSRSFNILSKL